MKLGLFPVFLVGLALLVLGFGLLGLWRPASAAPAHWTDVLCIAPGAGA